MAGRGMMQLSAVCIHAAPLDRRHPMTNQRPESEAQMLEFGAGDRVGLVQPDKASGTQLLQGDEVMLGQVVIVRHGSFSLQCRERDRPDPAMEFSARRQRAANASRTVGAGY
jgi:hypothetical protein